MAKKRITELATETTLKDGQYVAIDHTTDGTKKYNIGAELTDLKEELDNFSGLSEDVKQALLQIASKVAYVDEHGQEYYDDLYSAFYPSVTSISCVYTQSGTVYSTDSLDSLKTDLVVTVHYSDGKTSTLSSSDYGLSGNLTTGTSTIIVTYGNFTTTFEVLVTGVVSIDAVYTQSGAVYDTDTLSVLIPDLVVTATLSDETTFEVPSSDYVLSGTLSDPVSTITVTYGSLTDTFTVNVTEVIDYTKNPLDGVNWIDGYTYNPNTGVIVATTGEHCTEKFTAQSCIYILTNSDTTNNRYVALFAWDENGDYIGYIQYNASVFSLKKGYTYALKTYNTVTFDSSTITFMPKDNTSTAVSQFSISLNDLISGVTGGSRFEVNVASIMSGAGVSAGDIGTKINKCNYLAVLTPTSTTESFVNREFTFWFYNINTMMFYVKNVTTVSALETYLETHDITVTFN